MGGDRARDGAIDRGEESENEREREIEEEIFNPFSGFHDLRFRLIRVIRKRERERERERLGV